MAADLVLVLTSSTLDLELDVWPGSTAKENRLPAETVDVVENYMNMFTSMSVKDIWPF